MAARTLQTPTGPFTMVSEHGVLLRAYWGGNAADEDALLDEAARQMADYWAGRRRVFDLPWRLSGSEFQRAVWDRIAAIPFGETVTYGDIAKALGVPARAVGRACGANPLPIIVPCHRVMGAKGLTGFSGAAGVETKVTLLRHEGAAGLLI